MELIGGREQERKGVATKAGPLKTMPMGQLGSWPPGLVVSGMNQLLIPFSSCQDQRPFTQFVVA